MEMEETLTTITFSEGELERLQLALSAYCSQGGFHYVALLEKVTRGVKRIQGKRVEHRCQAIIAERQV